METLIETVAMFLGSERRQQRVEAEIGRQIALTDALHARLGAVVAPVVRRRAGVWQVSMAVPVEAPKIVSAVLTTMDEVFGRTAYELRLSRQAVTPAAPRQRAARPVGGLSRIYRILRAGTAEAAHRGDAP